MEAVLTVPIFPLPDVVFFPDTYLPLHIFEPRYRQMVEDCLRGGKRLSVVLLKPGWEVDYYGSPEIYRVAGLGEIVEHVRLPDGRFDILLFGLCRIAIEEELRSGKLYRLVRARRLRDRYPLEGPQGLAREAEALKILYQRLLAELRRGEGAFPQPPSSDSTTPGWPLRGRPPSAIVDWIASAAVVEAGIRQKLLEELDVRRRLKRLTSHLVELLMGLSDRDRSGLHKGKVH